MFASSVNADGDLYLCDEIWSTKPCNDQSKPVEGLPIISKPDLGISTIGDNKKEGVDEYDTKGVLEESVSEEDRCEPVLNGFDVRIIEAFLVQGQSGNLTLNGRVRNYATRSLASPLRLKVSESSGNIHRVYRVTETLMARNETTFSISLVAFQDNLGSVSRRLNLQLLYSPAAQCEIKKLDTRARVVAGSSTGGSLVQRKFLEKEELKALKEIAKDIQELKRTYRVRSLKNDLYMREVKNLNFRYSKFCLKGRGDAIRLNNECARLKNKIQGLYTQ